MSRRAWTAVVAAAMAVAVGVAWWILRPGTPRGEQPAGPGAGPGPVVSVTVAPIRRGTIREESTAYGQVVPAPGAIVAVSVPFQSRVLKIMVSTGQKVSAGEVLLELGPSPDTELQLQQAQKAYQATKATYQDVLRRRALKLATNDQVLAAKQALQQAKLRLQALRNQGIVSRNRVKASVAGLVQQVFVQEGAIVAAGSPLVELVAQNKVEVRLGVEPEDIDKVTVGQAVVLTRINAPAAGPTHGAVRKMSYAVNPKTRLVDVFVSVPSPDGFLLGEAVSGRFTLVASQGLIVPHSAVLPRRGEHVVFTVADGRAVEHVVHIGLETNEEYEIIGAGLEPGQPVVVVGNYQLENGMAVRVTGSR